MRITSKGRPFHTATTTSNNEEILKHYLDADSVSGAIFLTFVPEVGDCMVSINNEPFQVVDFIEIDERKPKISSLRVQDSGTTYQLEFYY